jgi:hypothetical protein
MAQRRLPMVELVFGRIEEEMNLPNQAHCVFLYFSFEQSRLYNSLPYIKMTLKKKPSESFTFTDVPIPAPRQSILAYAIRYSGSTSRKSKRHSSTISNQVRFEIHRLEVECASFISSAIRASAVNERKSMKILAKILKIGNKDTLQAVPQVRNVVRCSLILLQMYVANWKVLRASWSGQKERVTPKSLFHRLVYKLVPECIDDVLKEILDFVEEERLWGVHFMCCEILLSLLQCRTPPGLVMRTVLETFKQKVQDELITEARQVINIFNELLTYKFWDVESAKTIELVLPLYRQSVSGHPSGNPLSILRGGLEQCLQRVFHCMTQPQLRTMLLAMLAVVDNELVDDEEILYYGATVILAAQCRSECSPKMLDGALMTNLLAMMSSENRRKHALACQVLAHLLDSHKNSLAFVQPKVFFVETFYPISCQHEATAEDIEFFKRYMSQIDEAVLMAVRTHHGSLVNLTAIYLLICVITVEMPCGVTASVMATLAMKIQKMLFDDPVTETSTNQLHAIVISILSLIARVHRAKFLSRYVHEIVTKRYESAPHLNPPLKLVYQYAKHHVLWHRMSLFFDLWELRSGLWSHFRIKEEKLPFPKRE